MTFSINPLFGLVLFPLIIVVHSILFKSKLEKDNFTKEALIISSAITPLYSLYCLLLGHEDFSSILNGYTLNFVVSVFPFEGIVTFLLDKFSLIFVVLTAFTVHICMFVNYNMSNKKYVEMFILLMLIQSILTLAFLTNNIIAFYMLFELVLIPIFFIIGIWGSRNRKVLAAFQLFLYTLFGSLFMVFAIAYIYVTKGTLVLNDLIGTDWSFLEERLLWCAFFLAFAIKIPMVPFHTWLPEAHVEAPTSGSVLLAALLLKLGTFGLIKYSLALFPDASWYFAPFVYLVSLISILYSSLTTLRQIDLKKIIAYSSVGHMNFITLGIFSFNVQGLDGALLIMVSHAFISSTLFILVGSLYDKYHTRVLKYYRGLTVFMPILSTVFFIAVLGNLSMPGTSNFVGEFLILIGTFQKSPTTAVIAGLSIISTAAYSIWLYNRVFMGRLSIHIHQTRDINYDMTLPVSIVLIFLFIGLGVYPKILLESHMTPLLIKTQL
ncbi:NADH-ubiquinone oxidoreductase chain 4 (mitochondrion) [Fonticula alba]|uniref:NADH-ubiquinone oxidoreductase chain 4 n=1 Tax=Fonticula alba TaxID=691883 RepID=A0A058YYV1_FONAL|nr:NADH-ubiquinone oxidoreductase chain 4 [Fonticula alba]KCV67174.1 NADH-ubiquinone oxidoreductase chain 4 [Fonticula alba]|eukprot:XP_009498424.1 NADH-ubiquinone oxidoreductase chain 4 (mitochondrion) [Fonticula alba]